MYFRFGEITNLFDNMIDTSDDQLVMQVKAYVLDGDIQQGDSLTVRESLV